MNRLEVWIDDESLGGSAFVGHLSKTASRTGETISFEYDPNWLVSAGPVVGFPVDHELYFGMGQSRRAAPPRRLHATLNSCSAESFSTS